MTISRTELWRLVWFEMPPFRAAAQLGISNVAIKKLCERLNVPVPPRGHWVVKSGAAAIPLPAGPDVVATIRPSLQGKTELPHDPAGPNPLEALDADLEYARENNPRMFVCFWFECGCCLPSTVLARARWEHVQSGEGAWTIRGPIGRRGAMVEAPIAPLAVQNLSAFRKESGPIITNPDTDRRSLSWLFPPGTWRQRILELRGWLASQQLFTRRP